MEASGFSGAKKVKETRPAIINTSGILSTLKDFALPGSNPRDGPEWMKTLAVTTSEPVQIDDINDDLKREKIFYGQAMECVKLGRARLKSMSVPFIRPVDYFAEMLKSDDHMTKVREKLLSEKRRLEEGIEKRRMREQKKYGKKVQKAKQAEKEKKKKDEKESLKKWKEEIKANPKVELEKFFKDSAKNAMRKTKDDGPKKPASKREYKNSKFGYGGKKRGKKSNDSDSAGDFTKFNPKANKNGFNGGKKSGGGITKKRPGKNRRMKSMRK